MIGQAFIRPEMTRRRFLGLSLGGATALTLAGCGANGGSEGTESGRGEVLFQCRAGDQAEFYASIAGTFNSNAETNVQVQGVPAAGTPEYLQKIASQVAGGTAGDAMWTASIYNFFELAGAGAVRPLDSFVEENSYPLDPFFAQGIEGARLDDKLMGLPVFAHPGRAGVYYNKTAFEKAGIASPTPEWTYDDFLDAGEELTQRKGGRTTRYGFLPNNQPYFDLLVPLRSYGGDWLNAEGTEATFRGPGYDGLRTFLSIFKERPIAPTSGAQADFGFGELFTSGRAAMWQTGYWGLSAAGSNVKEFDWDVVPMPLGSDGLKTMFEFDANVIMSKASNVDTAWDYIAATSTQDAGILIGKLGSVPGARPDVWASETLGKRKGHSVWNQIIQNNAGPLIVPANYRFRELAKAVEDTLAPVYAGSVNVDAVADDLEEAVKGVLGRPPIG